MDQTIPLARLNYFRKEIGLDEARLSAITPHAAKLQAHSRKAGAYLDALFRKVAPRARMEMHLEYSADALKDFWTTWYSELWTRRWDDHFLSELWTQGAQAARIGIDLQYVMLGEIKCRQLFLRAVRGGDPAGRPGQAASAVNDLLDLCLLIRAKGHAAYRAHFAQPLLQGIFHQTRNPLTIIGGTAMRIKRQGGPETQDQAQVILDEALRLERMTRDISTLNAVELAEPDFKPLSVRPLLEQILDGLRHGRQWPPEAEASLELDPGRPEVAADPALAREIFAAVLLNALEALPEGQGQVLAASYADQATPSHLCISVSGQGQLPPGQDAAQLFLPFNSTKPMGTGFGLAIAQAAVRKCFGHISLRQDGPRTVCTVKLPLAGKIDEAGFWSQKDF